MALWQRETSRSSRAGERRDPLAAVRRHPIITFFVLAFVISWGFLPFEAVRFLPSGPLLAALIVAPLTQGWAGLHDLGSRMIRWRLRWYWYALAIGLPLAVHLINVVLNVALGTPAPSLAQFSPVYTILVVFAVRLVNPADGPLGEEPGWRGFAQPRLQAERSPLLATLILAVLVTVWHVPTFILEAGLQPSFILGGVLATLAVTACGDVLVRVAVQPHQRQRAHARSCALRRRQPAGPGVDLYGGMVGRGDRVGGPRLAVLAWPSASASDGASGV